MSSNYAKVSEAIAEVMFGPAQAGHPVYALMDDETLYKVLEIAGIENRTRQEFLSLVRTTLEIHGIGAEPFKWQEDAAKRHSRKPIETPPALPLLVTLSMAAEQMHGDGKIAANNYYARLLSLLQIPQNAHKKVESDYRRVATLLWGSLNSWLEAWEGERGIPTAYAVGPHPYVGLPMSQAVVRKHDRAGLHELFAIEGMAPGVRVSPSDMKLILEPYVKAAPNTPLTSHLIRLWKLPEARDRIISATCLELEAWDGDEHLESLATPRIASARLLAFMRSFPRKSLSFGLMFPYPAEESDIARFRHPKGEISAATSVGPGGFTRLSNAEDVSVESLLEERLSGMLGKHERRPFERSPRRIVPLRWDEIQSAFIEVERVSLCEDNIVLARQPVRNLLEDYLRKHARPGWIENSNFLGVPEGWVLYQEVQIVSAPTETVRVDLLPLVVSARSTLTLSGGFVLPGRLRKWSVLDPPEVVALSAGATSVSIHVYRGTQINPSDLIFETMGSSEIEVLPLADLNIVDGDYVVAMFVDGASRPSSTTLVRLRSANSSLHSFEQDQASLAYSPNSSVNWPLSAAAVVPEKHIKGPQVFGLDPQPGRSPQPMPEFAPRPKPATIFPQACTSLGTPVATDSCFVTGAHRMAVPPQLKDQPLRASVEIECTVCGIVRRAAGTPWAARKRSLDAENITLPALPPLAEPAAEGPNVAFDAVCHIGKGSLGAMRRILAQVDGSDMFVDSFIRTLEICGYVDVVRDDHLRVIKWEINPPTLVPTGRDRWVLIGARSNDMLDRLAKDLGGSLIVEESVELGFNQVEVVGGLADIVQLDPQVKVLTESPARTIARSLPPLSAVADMLKRTAVPSYRSAEFWDTTTASWQPTKSLTRPGAYRLKNFGSVYAVRGNEDIARGTLGLGNAQVVKHIANLWAEDPLARYNTKSSSVVTPLGADLPGLYGRALTLCSGRAPRTIKNFDLLQYQSVSRDIADIIYERLSR